MEACRVGSATTANSGSRTARSTTAGRRPRRRLTEDLSEDLHEAWERLRETAVEFGEQRIYASHNSIMFSRTSCYFFVRPKKSYLEVVRLSRPRAEGAAGETHRRGIEVEGRQLHPHHAPRRGRAADHRLASGSVRVDHEENDHEESAERKPRRSQPKKSKRR